MKYIVNHILYKTKNLISSLISNKESQFFFYKMYSRANNTRDVGTRDPINSLRITKLNEILKARWH